MSCGCWPFGPDWLRLRRHTERLPLLGGQLRRLPGDAARPARHHPRAHRRARLRRPVGTGVGRTPPQTAAAARPTGNYRSAAAREAHQGGQGQQAAYDSSSSSGAAAFGRGDDEDPDRDLRAGPGPAPLAVVPARQREPSAELKTQAYLDQLRAQFVTAWPVARGGHRGDPAGIEEALDRPAWPRRIRGHRVSVTVPRPDDNDRAGGVLCHLAGDRPHQ